MSDRSRLMLLLIPLISVLIFNGCVSPPAGQDTVIDETSQETIYETPQLRLVSMSPNITQIIYALGAGQQLVGVDEYSNYPEKAKTVPTMGSYLDPDIESLVLAMPDMVLVLDTDERMVELLNGLRLEHREFGNDTIEDILASIESLGELTDTEENAQALIDDYLITKADIETRLSGVEPISVVFVAGRNPGQLQDIIVAGRGNFIGEIISIAGGENVFGDLEIPWPQIGVESVIAMNPGIIIDTSLPDGSGDAMAETYRTDWSILSDHRAVQNDRVIIPQSEWFTIPGAHIGQILRLFAHWFHPDIFPDDVPDPFENNCPA